MSASESWKEAYRELVGTIVKMGYPEDFGKVIAKNLGSEKTMRRISSARRLKRFSFIKEAVFAILGKMGVITDHKIIVLYLYGLFVFQIATGIAAYRYLRQKY